MNKKKVVCLFLFLVLIIGLMVLLHNPPIEKREMELEGFNRYNRFVDKCLSEQFEIWKAVQRNEVFISEHNYRYSCAFAGDPTFLISVKMQFDNLDDYNKVCRQVQNLYPVIKMSKSLSICGNVSEDYQWFFDSVINDGRHVYLEYSFMDEEKMDIQFVFALLYDEMEKDEVIIEIAQKAYILANNCNYETIETERD